MPLYCSSALMTYKVNPSRQNKTPSLEIRAYYIKIATSDLIAVSLEHAKISNIVHAHENKL